MSPKRLPAAASSSSPSSSWYPRRCNDRFFSSLRGVEDRLASEDGSSRRSPRARAVSPPHQPTRSSDKSSRRSSPPSPSLSYSAPLVLDGHRGGPAQPHLVCSASTAQPESSDLPPLELLSGSIARRSPPSSPVAASGCPRPPGEDVDGDLEAHLERLVGLLGLTELEQGGVEGVWSGGDQEYSGGFLSRIAGVKGPRCRKEMERLDEWIRHYRSRRASDGDGGGGGAKAKREPARLAHLLLARAACAGGGGDGSDGFDGIGFPETVEDYFQHDPPGYSS